MKIYSIPLAKSSKNLCKSPVAPSWNLHSVFINKTRSIVVRDEFVPHNLQNNARQYDRAYRRLPRVLITYLPGRKVRELLKILLGKQLVRSALDNIPRMALLSSASFRNLMTSPMFGLRIRPSKTNMATQTANTAFSFPVVVDVFGWIYRKSNTIFICEGYLNDYNLYLTSYGCV